MIGMPGTSYRGPLPPTDEASRLLAGELRQDVTRLAVEIGERNVGDRPQQWSQAAEYLANQFSAVGFLPRRQEYLVSDVPCWNLEAELLGATRPEEILIVGAHYDTVPGSPGANDNSSGVAATLALARRFATRRTFRTLCFVAFANGICMPTPSRWGHGSTRGDAASEVKTSSAFRREGDARPPANHYRRRGDVQFHRKAVLKPLEGGSAPRSPRVQGC
jgi:hypothetical protein